MRKTYVIPKGSGYVTVEVTANNVVTVFEPDDPGTFLSEITGEIECIPGKGELAVFWGDVNPGSGIIAKLKDVSFDDDGCKFEAKNGLWYDHAIRFRNEGQYEKILRSNGR